MLGDFVSLGAHSIQIAGVSCFTAPASRIEVQNFYHAAVHFYKGTMDGPKEQDEIHPTLTKGMQVMGQTHRRSRLGAAADLMILARGGNVEDLAELAQEVDICKTTDSQGFTSLHLAAIGDHAETIRRLISLGAHIEARTPEGETPLHVAAQRGCSNAVKTLLELGADANAKDDEFNDTPLHKSTWGGHKACILLLLQAGADSRARDEDGCPPSELAKINHQPEALAIFQTAMSSMRVRSPNQRGNSLRRRNPIEFMLHPRK